MNEEKKARIRAINQMVQAWGNSSNTIYYVYSYYDSRCSNDSHQDFEEFNSLSDALQYVDKMKKEQYVVTLIAGEEMNI